MTLTDLVSIKQRLTSAITLLQNVTEALCSPSEHSKTPSQSKVLQAMEDIHAALTTLDKKLPVIPDRILEFTEFHAKEGDAGQYVGVCLSRQGPTGLSTHAYYRYEHEPVGEHSFWGHYFDTPDSAALDTVARADYLMRASEQYKSYTQANQYRRGE